MVQKSRRGLAGSYALKAVISLIEVKFLDRLMVSSTGLTSCLAPSIPSKSTLMVVARTQFLVGHRTKTSLPHWLSARGLPQFSTN